LYAAFAGAAERRQATLLSVRSLEDALRLAAARTRAGLGTELDVAQARAALAAARAQLPRLEAARDSVRLGLEALLGHLPGTLAPTLARLEAAPTVDAMPLMRTPVQVVASRPDLRAAEHELAAASATTAAAVRDRWPKLTLDVLIGVQSVRIAGPLAGDGLTSSLLAGLTGPLFDAGRLAARADAARARERAAAIAYRQAALEALGEVEDGLQRLAQAMAEDDQNAVAADAAAARVALARSRWRAGLVPFLDVVLAEQALHAANAERALSRSRMLESFARLSAAVGLGGEAGG
jgi:outer membrane protein TolC